MAIIDVNAYLGHYPFRAVDGSLDGAIKYMDRHQISAMIVSSLDAVFYRDCQSGNDELARALAARGDERLIPAAVINPAYPGAEDDLTRCQNQYNMKVVRLHPAHHGYALSSPEAIALGRRAAGMGMIIHLPLYLENIRQRHWLDTGDVIEIEDIAEFITACPEADIIISGLPSAGAADRLLGIERPGKLLIDFARLDVFSCAPGSNMLPLIEKYGASHFAFGSGYPLQYPDVQLVKLALSGLSKNDLDMIAGGLGEAAGALPLHPA